MRKSKKPFYTYIYFDVRLGHEGEAIYVGKGSCKKLNGETARLFSHWNRRDSHRNALFGRLLRRIAKMGLSPKMVVDRWHSTEEKAFKRETYLVAKYGLRTKGTGTLCNLTLGGEGSSGCSIGIEAFWEKHRNNRELLEKRAKTLRETCKNPELRKRYSEFTKKYWNSEEGKEKRSTIMKSLWASQEYRKKMVEKRKKQNNLPEVREKIGKAVSKAWERRAMTEEERVRRTEAAKRRWVEKREVILEGIKKVMSSPEVRAKLKAAWTKRKEQGLTRLGGV